jgi:hypothetical protein
MQPINCWTFFVVGTLAADYTWDWEVPIDVTLHKVFASASNDSSATLKVGTSATAEAYITEFAIGDSRTPVRKEAITDWNGSVALSQYPHVADGTRILLTLDHDGDGGTASQNVMIQVWWSPG